MSSRKHPATRRARFSRRAHHLRSLPAKFARLGAPIAGDDVLRDSQPFQFDDAGTLLERPLPWLPTIELADGRLAIRLEDAAEFPGRLEWPVIELADGSLAILLSDLWGGASTET